MEERIQFVAGGNFRLLVRNEAASFTPKTSIVVEVRLGKGHVQAIGTGTQFCHGMAGQ